MSTQVNRQWRIARRPVGRARAADFEWHEDRVPVPRPGQVLIRNEGCPSIRHCVHGCGTKTPSCRPWSSGCGDARCHRWGSRAIQKRSAARGNTRSRHDRIAELCAQRREGGTPSHASRRPCDIPANVRRTARPLGHRRVFRTDGRGSTPSGGNAGRFRGGRRHRILGRSRSASFRAVA